MLLLYSFCIAVRRSNIFSPVILKTTVGISHRSIISDLSHTSTVTSGVTEPSKVGGGGGGKICDFSSSHNMTTLSSPDPRPGHFFPSTHVYSLFDYFSAAHFANDANCAFADCFCGQHPIEPTEPARPSSWQFFTIIKFVQGRKRSITRALASNNAQ